MPFTFSKYSGCGNDFILIDNRSLKFPAHRPDIIIKLCHRQKGIGADGIILLENSQKAHYKMRIFNSDGSEAEMCGNGIRCLFKFIQQCGLSDSPLNIETMWKIQKVEGIDEEIAVVIGEPTAVQWNLSLSPWTVHLLDTGVPHAIIFLNEIHQLNLAECGPKVRFYPLFSPRGANANFAHLDAQGIVHLRTYERGVEQETYACGTGATATALAAAKIYSLKAPVFVKVRSGDTLKVDFQQQENTFTQQGNNFTNVRLIGPALHIFNGII